MPARKTGRIEYIEPNNLLYRDVYNDAVTYNASTGEKHFVANNDNGVIDSKIQGDRFMPYDLEDLCIAVDLYVMTNNRNNCGSPENDGDSVLAQYSGRGAASYMYGTDFDLPEQGAVGENSLTRKHFMTTNFTDISLVNPTGNTSECVGINSISIDYSNIFTPIVRITFVDVFGAAIFAKEERGMYDALEENRGKRVSEANKMSGSNLLASLFSYPYPTFVLTLKGFFGDAVAYHLVCSGTDIKFNESNGNFEINADFAGSLYGALADIPMSLISIAPYIDRSGRVYWKNETDTASGGRFYFTDDEGKNKTPMKTFAELLYQNDDLNDNIRKNFESYDEVKEYQSLITLRKMLGELDFPMSRENPGANLLLDTWYCRKENGRFYYYYCSAIVNGIENGGLYEMDSKIREELETFSDGISAINDSELGVTIPCPDVMLSDKLNAYVKVSGTTAVHLSPAYTIKRNSNGIFDDAKDYKGQSADVETLRKKYPVLNNFLTYDVLEDNKIRYVNLQEATEQIYVYEIISLCDYRQVLIKEKNNVISKIKEKQDKIDKLKRDALIELYGYIPSLKNINNVALAHLDTFMNVFYETLNNIDSKKISRERSIGTLGISLSQTDLPQGYSETAPIPPFTLFYAPTINNGKLTEDVKWPVDISNRLSNLDEVKLVEAIVDATSLYQKDTGDFIRNDSDIMDGNNRLPGNLFDAFENIKNPYSDILSKSYDASFIDYTIAVFCLRLYYYLSTTKTPNLNAFAHIEAKNFIAVYDKSYSENVLNYIIEQVKNNGIDYYLDKLCGRTVSSSAKERHWDIGKTNKNHGIFTQNGSEEFMYTWHKETTDYRKEDNPYTVTGAPMNEVYIMPIGVYNFSTIEKDFASQKSYNLKRYITLSNSAFGSNSEASFDSFNNKNSFRLVSKPCMALNLFKDRNVQVSLKDKSKTESLESIFFERITQHKDNGVYLPNNIFHNTKESTAATKTFDDLCNQGAADSIAGVYDITKNAINEKYSAVKTTDNKTPHNIFLTSVYYNQNTKYRGKDINLTNNEIKYSKAYLYLFSLINNRFGMLQSPGHNYERNGFFSYTELLKEGAFYWRLKFMMSHNNVDPINLNNLGYKHAAANEIYSLDTPFYPENKEVKTKCTGLTFIPSNVNSKNYTLAGPAIFDMDFAEYVQFSLRSSMARVENLMQLFMSWASGKKVFDDSKFTFANIANLQEIKVNGKELDLSGFIKLNGADFSTLDARLKAIYKPNGSDKISVKSNSYIDNFTIYKPSDKFNNTEITRFDEYKDMQIMTLTLLLDVYFVYDASIFGQNKTTMYKRGNFKGCFDTFISILKEYGYDKHDKAAIEHKNKFTSSDIKLSIYMTLKSLYDRWCCSKKDTYWKLGLGNETNSSNRECISQYFVYMDTYYNKIGHNLVVNMDDVVNMLKEFTPTYGGNTEIKNGLINSTVLSYMSHIAEKCGCMLYALPQDLTMRRADALSNMFKPVPYNKTDFAKDTSTFAIVYKTRYSEHLANDDGYEDDGFDLADSLGNINPLLPEAFSEDYKDGGVNDKIPAFGVTFGKGNQSYFTRIDFQSSKSSVAQSEWAIKALVDVAGSADGATKNAKSYGQDIYSQYANYSYQVTVTMLGCCQIMPLMYFQLNNIPLYHGAYIISSVSHRVSNGVMYTTFSGIRTSKYSLPLQPGNLLMLDSIDWGLEEINFSLEKDATIWDVSSINNTISPDMASKMTYEAVQNAKDFYKVLEAQAEAEAKAKSPDKNTKLLKKLKGMSLSQKTVINTYFAAYDYSVNCAISNKDTKLEEEYNKYFTNFSGENEIIPVANTPRANGGFKDILSKIGYDVTIEIGTALSGRVTDNVTEGEEKTDNIVTDLEQRLKQLRPAYGDIVVYYATSVIDDRINDKSRHFSLIEKNRIKGSDFEFVSDGIALFYYGDKNNSQNKFIFSDKDGIKMEDVFLFTGDSNLVPENPNHTTLIKPRDPIHPDCYKWDVVLYRRSPFRLGSSVKEKEDERK